MQPGTKLQAEVHLKEKNQSDMQTFSSFLFVLLDLILLTVVAINSGGRFLFTVFFVHLTVVRAPAGSGFSISSCHWLSTESSDWFSVCLAHRPVGFRTRITILCACARANVRVLCFTGDNLCQCVLMYCIGKLGCVFVSVTIFVC